MMEEYQYFHVSRHGNLVAIRPSKFDAFGRMPEPAIFITTREFITRWAIYIGEFRRSLYLYGINSPPDLRIEEGEDGAEGGDFKIITSKPVLADFICTL